MTYAEFHAANESAAATYLRDMWSLDQTGKRGASEQKMRLAIEDARDAAFETARREIEATPIEQRGDRGALATGSGAGMG